MNYSFLINEQLCLRAPEPEDLDVMYQMENNPQFWSMSSITVPYSRYVLREYITASQSDFFSDKQLRLMLVHRVDNLVIGTIDLTDFYPLHGRAAVGIAILNEYQRKGFARQALEMLCRYAFDFLHLKQLYAHVSVSNLPSLALFNACGFVQGGVLKDWLRTSDGYEDAVIVQRIN